MPPASPRLRLVVPGNVRHNSGGNVYNAALARELTALGAVVETCPLDGDWPGGSAGDRRRLARLLNAESTNPGSATGSVMVVDSLLACGAPDELEEAAAAGQQVWILLHMPLPDNSERERRALQAAAGVICTSGSAAAGIRARHGLDGIRVALPGTAPAPLAAGSLSAGAGVPHIIAVAALLENKDQSLLLDALARLTDLPWTASLIGSDTAHPAYAAQLRNSVECLGLAGRVSIPGELRGPALEAEWDAADLSLLISRAETYGLVVTESLARGIPVVVREGTGAVEALGAGSRPSAPGPDNRPDNRPVSRPDVPVPDTPLPGAAVGLGTDPAPLADLLRRWLGDEALRERWRDAAADARGRLPGWDATARTVLELLSTESTESTESPETGDTGKPVAQVDTAS
ncbi:Mannosylfructose-phosphate synthase [Arthrobacter sp. Bi26]|uniref:glycosyltransferase family 4 protein n=1 Tax=Arthrobacter sp. Bi26 TaxID=2822350 RepID=UPI001DE486F5|nr:glycosyltransferase family 4 protein [Arthrobacter sp. Bi26]CAH0251685.1 Mannosylfructose-phosphate synthase [Arthrobacter sp. Bi26]